jgi:hypothetical protein
MECCSNCADYAFEGDRACSNAACPCHAPHTPESWEPTPEWQMRAKYRAVLQLVLAGNDWSDKYPTLEKVIDGLLASQRSSLKASIEGMRKYCHESNFLAQPRNGRDKGNNFCAGCAEAHKNNIIVSDVLSLLKED